MEVAETIAKLGTCERARVGAVLTRRGRAISWGYNGAPPGLPHCNENNHGWGDREVDKSTHPEPPLMLPAAEVLGCNNATHAEANALAFAARQGISTDDCTLYVTYSPCASCARLIIAAGISRVVVRYIYRDPQGWNLLGEAGIERSTIMLPPIYPKVS